MRILMDGLSANEVLAGAINGRKVQARLMELTNREPAEPEPVFLDFISVKVATASFLRESVLAFRNEVRRRRSKFYPVVANANDVVEEELRVLVVPQGDVLMLCRLDETGKVIESSLAGELDPKQLVTFNLVQERGTTDAAQLMRDHGDAEGVKQTAWNNRLATLAGLGLLVELSQGRSKRYRPLFSES
jgi:hypothetical protein